jgi:hypothetical protein
VSFSLNKKLGGDFAKIRGGPSNFGIMSPTKVVGGGSLLGKLFKHQPIVHRRFYLGRQNPLLRPAKGGYADAMKWVPGVPNLLKRRVK